MSEILAGVLKRPRRSPRTGTPRTDARTRAIEAVRQAVTTALPTGSVVLVVSRGDPELVRLPEREGRHFPSTPDGRYAGFHPADSSAALQELERHLGDVQYLLIPASSFWWLDYYREFADVLNTRYERVWSDADCVIFRLSPRPAASMPLKRLRGVVTAPSASVRGNGHAKRVGTRRERVK